jgi:hypothetical protein
MFKSKSLSIRTLLSKRISTLITFRKYVTIFSSATDTSNGFTFTNLFRIYSIAASSQIRINPGLLSPSPKRQFLDVIVTEHVKDPIRSINSN